MASSLKLTSALLNLSPKPASYSSTFCWQALPSLRCVMFTVKKPISILPSSSTLSSSTTSVCKLSQVSDAYIYTLKNIVLLPREPQAPQMLHFNLTMDAASVLNCSPIDHRCSFTNCGKVICLRNRNHRHELCSPSQKPHIISLSKSSTPRETDFARRQIFIIHTLQPPCTSTRIPQRDLH